MILLGFLNRNLRFMRDTITHKEIENFVDRTIKKYNEKKSDVNRKLP
jgi:hypothetical protein